MNNEDKHTKMALDLPEYLNGRLSSRAIERVEDWLHSSPDAAQEFETWKSIQKAVMAQPVIEPSYKVWSSIQNKLSANQKTWREWVQPVFLGSLFAVLILSFLWILIRPGYTLQWSAQATGAQQFDIYRAPAGSNEFILLASVDAQGANQEYRYVDSMAIPGRTYVYRVEGTGVEGLTAISQPLTSDPLTALPGQLAVVFSSLILSIVLVQLGRFTVDHTPAWKVPAAL